MSDVVLLAIITGLFALLTVALNVLAVGYSRYLSHLESAKTAEKVADVHTIVNQQRTEMLAEIKSLKSELAIQAGVARALTEKTTAPAPAPGSRAAPVHVMEIAPGAAQAIKDATAKEEL